MFNIAKEIRGYMNKRFIIAIFFPIVLFSAATVGLIVTTGDFSQLQYMWSQEPGEIKLGVFLCFMTLDILFASFLSSSLTILIRFYEGYWESIPGLRYFAKFRRNH